MNESSLLSKIIFIWGHLKIVSFQASLKALAHHDWVVGKLESVRPVIDELDHGVELLSVAIQPVDHL